MTGEHRRLRLAVIVSHPIQYLVPWFRHLDSVLHIEVLYGHRQGPKGQAEAGFGVEFEWDIPLLDGYRYRWLENVARHPSLRTFDGCDTPGVGSVLEAGEFDGVLVFGWNRKSSLQAITAARRLGVPVLMRGDSRLGAPGAWWRGVAKFVPYRLLLRRLDAHLFVGTRNREYLRHYGVPEDRLFFVPHFVDNDFFADRARDAVGSGATVRWRRELGIEPEAFVFLFVGKLIDKKRPADFVRACAQVCSSEAGAGCAGLVVGDGPLRTSLEGLAGDAPIRFAGFLNQTELPLAYGASDAIVLPSTSGETWGLAINEAAACGLPAVVSDAVGCAPDMIEEGVTGFTYPVGDVEALASRMEGLRAAVDARGEGIRDAVLDRSVRYSIPAATRGLLESLAAVTPSGSPRRWDAVAGDRGLR